MTLIENITLTDDYAANRQMPRAGEKELKLLKRMAGMYMLAEREKKKFTRSWKTNYKFYMGDQWGPTPSWRSRPVENHVFSKTETVIPVLTDNRPKIDVLPRSPECSDYAEFMQYLMDWHWEQNNSSSMLAVLCRNVFAFGKGFLYPYYNVDDERVCLDSVNPQDVTPDPDATSIASSRFVFIRSRMSLSEILAYWPDAHGKLVAGTRTLRENDRDFAESLDATNSDRWDGYEYPLAAGDPFTRVVPWVASDLGAIGRESDSCDVVTAYVRDPEVIQEELCDPETGEPMCYEDGEKVMIKRPRFPGGRQIVLCGNRVIHDGPNPYQHGEIPLVDVDCHRFPGEFWPVSGVSNLVSPQKYLNKINGQILDNAKLMGNGQWYVEEGSGVVAKRLSGKPGLVVRGRRGYKVEKLSGTPLPSFIQAIPDALRAALDNISGVFDVTQGRKPAGITAGVAIEQLQEAAQTRLRLLVRNLEDSLEIAGRQMVGLMQQYYDEPRQIRIQDEMGQFQFIEVTPEVIRGSWEVQVAAGSTLPRSREAQQREAQNLFDRGIFDAEDFLQWTDHPGRYKAIRKLKEREALQQQLAAVMGGGAPTSGSMGAQSPPTSGAPPARKPQVSGRGNGMAGPPR